MPQAARRVSYDYPYDYENGRRVYPSDGGTSSRCVYPTCHNFPSSRQTQLCELHWERVNTRRRVLADGYEGPPRPFYAETIPANQLFRHWVMYRPGRPNVFICTSCAQRQYVDARDELLMSDEAERFPELDPDLTDDCTLCTLCRGGWSGRRRCLTHSEHNCGCDSRNDDCSDCHDYDTCGGHCDFSCECTDSYCCEREDEEGSCRWCGTDDCEQNTAPWCDGSTFTVILTQQPTEITPNN